MNLIDQIIEATVPNWEYEWQEGYKSAKVLLTFMSADRAAQTLNPDGDKAFCAGFRTALTSLAGYVWPLST